MVIPVLGAGGSWTDPAHGNANTQQSAAGRGMRAWGGAEAVELLPSPQRQERERSEGSIVDDAVVVGRSGGADVDRTTIAPNRPGLAIRGSAEEATQRRLSLRVKLERAKAEARAKAAAAGQSLAAPPSAPATAHNDPSSPTDAEVHALLPPAAATALALKSPRVKAIVLARLRLRQKLALERQAYAQQLETQERSENESRAQELRRRILASRAARAATEKDAELRDLDKEDRKRELRRRLAVEMMRRAETEGEKRERELKERAVGAKRARFLRELLRARKGGQAAAADGIATRAVSEQHVAVTA